MLTELSLKNFKAWKDIDKMRLAQITGLFGTNSSGKSSILQFQRLANNSANRAKCAAGQHLELPNRAPGFMPITVSSLAMPYRSRS